MAGDLLDSTSTSENIAPPSGRLDASSRPPWTRATHPAMARPRPEPGTPTAAGPLVTHGVLHQVADGTPHQLGVGFDHLEGYAA